jgi:hypothetical protein
MKSLTLLVGIVAALMLSGGAAFAEDIYSANYVMPGCRDFASATDNPKLVFRSGICAGVIRVLIYLGDSCKPPEGTAEQTARVIVQYIDSRPARMHEDFISLAIEAMKAAWPCQR